METKHAFETYRSSSLEAENGSEALASSLLDAFQLQGQGAALEALSRAAPWAFVDLSAALSLHLATEEPSRLLSVLETLSHVLKEGQRLSAWAMERLHGLCAARSSRLLRPAMRCLCASGLEPVLRELRPAVWQLQEHLAAPSAAVLRSAWLSGCACEFMELDRLKASDLWPTKQQEVQRRAEDLMN